MPEFDNIFSSRVLDPLTMHSLKEVPSATPADLSISEEKISPPPSDKKNAHVYRPDIDGLRAIAILAVIVFHAFPSKLKGGFVGVDIFFVISGYLISSIIMRDVDQGRFSFIRFYINRIKRIFPALLLVLVCCFLFGYYALLSDEFSSLGKHIASGLGFVQNITLYLESGYFDKASDLKPLLHLWSLGVEEQFYLIFPVLLIFAWRFRNRVLNLIILCTVLSFILSIVVIQKDVTLAFYLPLTRFWEMLIGAIIAYLSMYSPVRPFSFLKKYDLWRQFKENQDIRIKWANVCSFIGLFLLLSSFFVIKQKRLFPGWWVLLPTIGALLIIIAGPRAWVNRVILANRIMVWIGLISYPLYLWHWPLFSFGKIVFVNQDFPTYVSLSILCLSVFLAWITYQFVEKPIRFGAHFEKKAFFLLMSGLILLFIGLLTYFEKIPTRKKYQSIPDIILATVEWEYPKNLNRMMINGVQLYGLDGASKTFFAGDSNAEQYSPRVVSFLKNASQGRGAIFLTRGGCLPIRGSETSTENPKRCRQLQEDILRVAKDESIDTIVLSAVWFIYFSNETNWKIDGLSLSTDEGRATAMLSLQKMLKEMARKGRRIFIVSNIPYGVELNPKSLVQRNIFRDELVINNKFIRKDQFIEKNRAVYDSLKRLTKDNEITFIDPSSFLCADNLCPAIDEDGTVIYTDGAHLRPTFVKNKLTYLDVTLASP